MTDSKNQNFLLISSYLTGERQQIVADAKQLAKSQTKRTEIGFEKPSSSTSQSHHRQWSRVNDGERLSIVDPVRDRERNPKDRDRRRGSSRSPQGRK